MIALPLLAALGLCVSLSSAHPRAGSLSRDEPTKAIFLSRFPPFVSWPARTFPAPASPFVLCLIGPDPFGLALDHAVHGERVGARPILVRRVSAVGRESGCHMLFIGDVGDEAAADILRSVKGRPILTVTDGAAAGSRGIIHFTIKDRRVRFLIDDQAAADNGLTISSKLKGMALSVRKRR